MAFPLRRPFASSPIQSAVTRQDRVENGEQRWQTIGAVGGFTLLLVAHTLWDDEAGIEVVRIISARRADRKERRIYENG